MWFEASGFCASAVLVIGFDLDSDVFAEESGRGSVTIRVISGILERSVRVVLQTMSGTAIGELTLNVMLLVITLCGCPAI